MSTSYPSPRGGLTSQRTQSTLAYVGVLLFVLVYCTRPGEWFPGMYAFPFAKLTGVLAILGFLFTVFVERRGVLKLPAEMVCLLALFMQFCLAVPFAVWRGGSFAVVSEFWKVVLVALIIVLTVNTLPRLRKLIFVQTASVAVISLMSLVGFGERTYGRESYRIGGAIGGIFQNPNDFAWAIALVFPSCLYFMLRRRNPFVKLFWISAMVVLAIALLKTYSRGGLISLIAAVSVCVWEFGIKGKRHHLVALFLIGGFVALVVVAPDQLFDRLAAVWNPRADSTAAASSTMRWELLLQGLVLTAKHPLFGIGAGNFAIVTGTWLGTHNTFVELSSENGLPALFLYLFILRRSFTNVRKGREKVAALAEHQLVAGALRGTLVGFTVGAFFSHVSYHFFPYMLFAYTGAFYQIGLLDGATSETAEVAESAQK